MTATLPLEQRPISEMTFGLNKCAPNPALGEGQSETWQPTKEQEEEQTWVRNYLDGVGCVVAGDIEKLGCTGIAKFEIGIGVVSREVAINNAITLGTRLRLGLAGSGVGLPCFVPPTRYCLLHDTIGGLEKRQVQHHAEFVDLISRPLTPEEEAKVAAMNRASTMKSVGELNDFIAGKTEAGETEASNSEAETRGVQLLPSVWKCPEHSKTEWACRYCVAQAIIEGPIDMEFYVGPISADTDSILGQTVETALASCDKKGLNRVRVFVQCAVFSRKLSRD